MSRPPVQHSRYRWLSGLLFLLAAPACLAHEQTQARAGVTAQLRAEPAAVAGKLLIRLSGELVVTLTVETPVGVVLGPLPEITASKVWRRQSPRTGWLTTKLDEGRVRWRQTYHLSPWQPGEVPLPLLPLRFRPDRERQDWEEIIWQPVPVTVTTSVRDADPRGARESTGIEQQPALDDPETWPLPFAATVAGLVGVLVLWLLYGRRAGPRPIAPAAWAQGELIRLGEPAAADGPRFLGELAAILRRYLELRFGFHAPRQTTAEFLRAARQSSALTEPQWALLGEVLMECDLAKFAQSRPLPEECRAILTRTRAFLEETTPQRKQG